MSSSSSLTSIVNLDAETAIKLSQFIASLGSGAPDAAFADACKSLIENAQTEALVTKFLTKQDAFFALESDSDIEGIFQAIVSIAFTLGDASVVPAVIKQLISALTASTDSRQTIRLRVLASLFNLATADQSKFDLMSAILKYALASGQAKEVAHFHNRVEGWVSSWNLKPAEKQGIYSDTIQVLEASGQSSMAMRYKIKYLESFAGEPFSDKVILMMMTPHLIQFIHLIHLIHLTRDMYSSMATCDCVGIILLHSTQSRIFFNPHTLYAPNHLTNSYTHLI